MLHAFRTVQSSPDIKTAFEIWPGVNPDNHKPKSPIR